MRFRLDFSVQRRLFLDLKNNKTWSELAKELDTNVSTLKAYTFDGVTIPQQIYEKLKQHIPKLVAVEKLPENWGKTKGGKNSLGSTKAINHPPLDEKLAEIVGIMLGDGSNYVNLPKGTYQVRVASNFRTEQEYLLKFMKPLFENLFKINGWILKRPRLGCIYLCFDSKELVYFLDSVGVPCDSRKSKAPIPNWIKARKPFLVSCLRGLFDTDGSVFLYNKPRDLVRISFKNANSRLLNDVRASLLQLGFHPNKMTYRTVSLTRKEDVARFVREIGFNNFKNQERFRSFNSPVV